MTEPAGDSSSMGDNNEGESPSPALLPCQNSPTNPFVASVRLTGARCGPTWGHWGPSPWGIEALRNSGMGGADPEPAWGPFQLPRSGLTDLLPARGPIW